MFALLLLLADGATTPPANPAPAPTGNPLGDMTFFVPLILIFVIGYFLMIRPMRKQEADRKAMAGNLRKNDKVLTSAGI